MDAHIARYGPFILYGYTVLLALGFLSALGLTAALNRKASRSAWFDAALVATFGALIGGRLLFVWINADYFAVHRDESWQIWRGGLAYHGALLGGMVGLLLWAITARKPLLPMAALLAPGLALIVVFGWLACAAEACAFGREIPIGGVAFVDLVAAELPDELGIVTLRYRTQATGALFSLVVLAGVLWLKGREAHPAVVLAATIAGISLTRALVAPLRGDLVPTVVGYRADLLFDAGLALFAGAIGLAFLLARPRTQIDTG